MGKGINISKYKTENNVYYYLVFKYNDLFYIGIEPSKKIIRFYKNKDFTQPPLGIINLNHEPPLKDIPGLNKSDVGMAAMQAAIAIYKNEFPKYIGFSS